MHKQGMRGFPKNGALSVFSREEWITASGASEWIWPENVSAAMVTLVAPGGGGDGGAGGADGGDTTITYNGVTITANGGLGADSGSGGGTGGNGNIYNFTGMPGATSGATGGRGGDTPLGFGQGASGGVVFDGAGFGSGGYETRGGGSGEVVRHRLLRVAGQNIVFCNLGIAGKDTGPNDCEGGPGLIIFEY